MLKVGVDCEDISRFRAKPYSANKRFYKRIFTPQEIRYCLSFRDPYPRFTARFAAKEASIKALSGIRIPSYKDVEVRKDGRRQPSISLNRARFRLSKDISMLLSMSHSRTHAIALTVVVDDKRDIPKARRVLRDGTSQIRDVTCRSDDDL